MRLPQKPPSVHATAFLKPDSPHRVPCRLPHRWPAPHPAAGTGAPPCGGSDGTARSGTLSVRGRGARGRRQTDGARRVLGYFARRRVPAEGTFTMTGRGVLAGDGYRIASCRLIPFDARTFDAIWSPRPR
jgi:hypothetical protein